MNSLVFHIFVPLFTPFTLFLRQRVFANSIVGSGRRCSANFTVAFRNFVQHVFFQLVIHYACVYIVRYDCSRTLARRKTRTEIVVATPYNDNIDIIQDSRNCWFRWQCNLYHIRNKGRILSRSRHII